MKKNWKVLAYGMAVAAILSMTACSADEEKENLFFTEEETETENLSLIEEEMETENPPSAGEETIVNIEEFATNQQESNMQEFEDTDFEATAEELLDSFINGSINAVDSTDLTSTFCITDLNMDSEEWDSYSIGEKVDLDNDGENELIISGPYGGIYLDARDNKVYEFAAGDGNAITLSYTYYNGAVWIMYSNSMNAGYKCYHMERFEGADNLVGEMSFSEELVDQNNSESGMKYTLNGTEISYDEYTDLCSKIFAAQVNTSF